MAVINDEFYEQPIENLVASTNPQLEAFTIQLTAGKGLLKRGSLLTKEDDGYEIIKAGTTGKANCVLAEDVDTGDDAGDAVTAIAYRSGHFQENGLIVSDGYEITDADKENLRDLGILVSAAF
jgi:hypothetical protein